MKKECRLPTIEQIHKELPLSGQEKISLFRKSINDILLGNDPRLLVIVGPCALQDADSAIEYGKRLFKLQQRVKERLFLVMRAYAEKPRTRSSWKGFVHSHEGSVAKGIIETRQLLLALTEIGIALATEFVSPFLADYFSDLISWGAIGARTVLSPVHRELASRLPMAIGMKNTLDGTFEPAICAIESVSQEQPTIITATSGSVCQAYSPGNPYAHLVLRGGNGGPNYTRVKKAKDLLHEARLQEAILVDCSHGNSQYMWERQPKVCKEVLEHSLPFIQGIMVESFLCGGTGDAIGSGHSVVDGCLGWDETEKLIVHAHRQCALTRKDL